MERIIFRKEKRNPYFEQSYIAAFPDDPANPGNICATPFHINNDTDRSITFEPFTEVSDAYYYNDTTIVHKTAPITDKLLRAFEEYYSVDFKICEKR